MLLALNHIFESFDNMYVHVFKKFTLKSIPMCINDSILRSRGISIVIFVHRYNACLYYWSVTPRLVFKSSSYEFDL